MKNRYNSRTDSLKAHVVEDDNIKAAHVVMIPHLGVMAIEDRIGDLNISQRAAIRALRSIILNVLEDGDFSVTYLSADEATKALTEWNLVQYDYTIRPLNPIRPSDFSVLRSDAMKLDGAATDSGRIKPADGQHMKAEGGIISRTEEVVSAGYGQSGGRAITPGGNEARVPKPRFFMDTKKNLAEQEKERFLKIIFDVEDDETVSPAQIARTLRDFYDD